MSFLALARKYLTGEMSMDDTDDSGRGGCCCTYIIVLLEHLILVPEYRCCSPLPCVRLYMRSMYFIRFRFVSSRTLLCLGT